MTQLSCCDLNDAYVVHRGIVSLECSIAYVRNAAIASGVRTCSTINLSDFFSRVGREGHSVAPESTTASTSLVADERWPTNAEVVTACFCHDDERIFLFVLFDGLLTVSLKK